MAGRLWLAVERLAGRGSITLRLAMPRPATSTTRNPPHECGG